MWWEMVYAFHNNFYEYNPIFRMTTHKLIEIMMKMFIFSLNIYKFYYFWERAKKYSVLFRINAGSWVLIRPHSDMSLLFRSTELHGYYSAFIGAEAAVVAAAVAAAGHPNEVEDWTTFPSA